MCVCAHLGVCFILVLKEKGKMWQLLPRRPPHTLAWTFSPGRVTKAQIAKPLRWILKGLLISVQWWWVCHRRKHVLGQKLSFQQLSCSSFWIFFPTLPFLCNHFWSKLNHFLFLRLPAGNVGLWSWAERQSEGEPGWARHARNYSESGDLTGEYFNKSDSAPRRYNQCLTDGRLLLQSL